MATATTSDPAASTPIDGLVSPDAPPAASAVYALAQLEFARWCAVEAFGALERVPGSDQPAAAMKEVIAQLDRIASEVESL